VAETFSMNGWFVSGKCQPTKTNYSMLFFNYMTHTHTHILTYLHTLTYILTYLHTLTYLLIYLLTYLHTLT